MRAERNDLIARLEIADDRSRFVAKAAELHAAPGDPKCFPFDQPYARATARIEDRADRYTNRRTGRAVGSRDSRDLDRDRCAQRGVCEATLQYVPSFERSSLTV